MSPLFAFVATGLAFAVTFTEVAPLYTPLRERARCFEPCYVAAAPAEGRPRFDVGSRGPGFAFLQQGTMRVVTPTL